MYSQAYPIVNEARIIIDEQIAKRMQDQERRDQEIVDGIRYSARIIAIETERFQREGRELTNNAEILSITIDHISREQADFIRRAVNRIRWLEEKLNPQWESRDAARSRIGSERWENNANPSNVYSDMRYEQEQELREARKAVDVVQTFDYSNADYSGIFFD